MYMMNARILNTLRSDMTKNNFTPFDSDKQIAIIKCSICTGEQVAGFKSKEDGHFTEIMLIRDDEDLAKFKKKYKIAEIKKKY